MITKVFAYGSLLNPESAARTLGRPYQPEQVEKARLNGFVRQYDTKSASPDHPGQTVSYLNVIETGNPDDRVNGVLLDVNDQELAALIEREKGYDLLDVTNHIEPPPGEGVKVLTFACPDCHRVKPGETDSFVKSQYVQTVQAGVRLYGDTFAREFEETTRPIDLPIKGDDDESET